MLCTFYLEESFSRFTGIFNKLYSQKNKSINIEINPEINNIIKNCKLINHADRKLYIYEENEYFINVIEIKARTYRCYKYVTKKYYDIHNYIYSMLFDNGYYNLDEFKKFETERIEIYVFDTFLGRTFFDTKELTENNIISKFNFNKQFIHDKLDINKLNFIENNKIKGTLIDLCIKYMLNNNYDHACEYIKSCNSLELNETINNCNNTQDLINILFDNTFIDNINKLKEKFDGICTTDCYVNFELGTYGEPDLISDNYIIDIKISDNKIDCVKNYLQSLFHAISMNKKNICLYDPVNGIIYKNEIVDNRFKIVKDYILKKNKIIIKKCLTHEMFMDEDIEYIRC
jgi:hypothetical protein